MNVQRQIDRLIVHRASEWLEVLRAEQTEDYPAFIQWISESPRHMDEFLQLLAVSREARLAVRGESIDKMRLLERLSPKIVELRGADYEPLSDPSVKRTWMRWAGALAATVAALSLVALWIGGGLSSWKSFETPIGEQRIIELADGSVVTLNARSTILVRITAAGRDIQLLRGDALFRVARHAQHPFRVHTADAVVHAVGTQFNVTTRPAGTHVTVIEGKVRLEAKEVSTRPHQRPSPELVQLPERMVSAPLEAGEAARVSPLGIERKAAHEIERAIAWSRRRLIFERTPLEEAVDELNRYHPSTQLRLEGIRSGSHHYSGTFDADDLASFIDILSREKDLVVERRDREVIVRAR